MEGGLCLWDSFHVWMQGACCRKYLGSEVVQSILHRDPCILGDGMHYRAAGLDKLL